MMTTGLLLMVGLAATAFYTQTIRPGFYELRPLSGVEGMGENNPNWQGPSQGIGSVFAPEGVDDTGVGEPAELLVREQPSDSAPIVAYAGFVYSAEHGHPVHAIAAREPDLLGEFTRVTHDYYGLVVDRVEGGWARTIYGYTRRGDARKGWVRLVPERIAYKSYDQQIVDHIVWFENPASVELFDRPNGRRIRFPLPPPGPLGRDSYSLTVLAIKGSWIAVQLTVPNTNWCSGDPDAKVERSTHAWIRRHDRRGRNQIAYAPAGC